MGTTTPGPDGVHNLLGLLGPPRCRSPPTGSRAASTPLELLYNLLRGHTAHVPKVGDPHPAPFQQVDGGWGPRFFPSQSSWYQGRAVTLDGSLPPAGEAHPRPVVVVVVLVAAQAPGPPSRRCPRSRERSPARRGPATMMLSPQVTRKQECPSHVMVIPIEKTSFGGLSRQFSPLYHIPGGFFTCPRGKFPAGGSPPCFSGERAAPPGGAGPGRSPAPPHSPGRGTAARCTRWRRPHRFPAPGPGAAW